MEIAQAQHDVRTTFLGGFVGSLVSAVIWAASAALATWSTPRHAIVSLVAGGFFIFPLTQLVLRLMGRPSGLPKGHPMNALAMQIAFTMPMNVLIVLAAATCRLDWFYPACMIALGAHYLPFVFLYGMWEFGALGVTLIGAGFIMGAYLPVPFAAGGWCAAAILFVFAFVGRSVARR